MTGREERTPTFRFSRRVTPEMSLEMSYSTNSWRCGSKNGIGGLLHEERNGPVETLIYVQVPDLQKALNAAEKLGGKTIVPPTSTVGSRRIAQFEDPEGNIIGLVQG